MTDEDPVIRFRARDGFHPAMKRRPDDTLPPQMIHRNPHVDAEQERLRRIAGAAAEIRALAEKERQRAAYGPKWEEVEMLSKHEAKVGGTLVTLNKGTGDLSCAMHRGEDDCWHIRRLLEVATLRRRKP